MIANPALQGAYSGRWIRFANARDALYIRFLSGCMYLMPLAACWHVVLRYDADVDYVCAQKP